MNTSPGSTIKIESRVCPMCHGFKVFEVSAEAYKRWNNGAMIQDAFPEMSADDRERMISGTCGPCWNQLFAGPDDEEEPEDNDN